MRSPFPSPQPRPMTPPPAPSPVNPLSCVDLSGIDVYTDACRTDSRYRVAVETMASQGAPVQFWSKVYASWQDTLGCPMWTWDVNSYRIDPASCPKVMVPWSQPSDVPGAVVWIREGGSAVERLVLGINHRGLVMTRTLSDTNRAPFLLRWSDLAGFQHSVDRVNWAPCTRPASQGSP